MKKRVSIMIAACAAFAVVFVGVNSFACGGNCSKKSASLQNTSAACASSYASKSADKSSCASGANTDWTANVCGSKGYYSANVYDVRDGHMYAVCEGRTFEVTNNTPYTQVGEARYYFADNAAKISCPVQMSQKSAQIDKETVSLATLEGNVVGEQNGQKIAQCMTTGKQFLITADSPVRMVDGKKYYLNDTTDLSSVAESHN
jgi:hypothetical protein